MWQSGKWEGYLLRSKTNPTADIRTPPLNTSSSTLLARVEPPFRNLCQGCERKLYHLFWIHLLRVGLSCINCSLSDICSPKFLPSRRQGSVARFSWRVLLVVIQGLLYRVSSMLSQDCAWMRMEPTSNGKGCLCCIFDCRLWMLKMRRLAIYAIFIPESPISFPNTVQNCSGHHIHQPTSRSPLFYGTCNSDCILKQLLNWQWTQRM